MMGRVYSLQRRLETEPIPELFDDPIATWLPARTDRDHDHGIEINYLLDKALACAIRSTVGLSASTLWRWAVSVRRETWSELKRETVKAWPGGWTKDRSARSLFLTKFSRRMMG